MPKRSRRTAALWAALWVMVASPGAATESRPVASEATAPRRPLDEAGGGSLGCDDYELLGVELEGCEGYSCGDPDRREGLTRAARQVIGPRTSDRAVRQAARTLVSTGFAVEVTPRCALASGTQETQGAYVVFSIKPSHIIREIAIDGAGYFYSDEIRKRLFLREGAFFAPDTPQARTQLRRQRETLLHAYEREGFDRTRVEVATEPLDSGTLRLLVRIDEGQRRRIDRVRIRLHPPGATAPTTSTEDADGERGAPSGEAIAPSTADVGPAQDPAPPARVVAAGPRRPGRERDDRWTCHRFAERALQRLAGLSDFNVYTDRSAREIRERLRETVQRYGWVRPRVELSYDTEAAELLATVEADNCYLVHYRVRQSGSKGDRYVRRDVPEWRQLMSFGSSGAFDFEESEYNRRLLQADLEQSGYLFSDVVLDYRRLHAHNRRLADGRVVPEPVAGIITFDVTEGSITEVRRVSFPGLAAFSRSDVLSKMKTRPYDFFSDGGYLRIEQLFADMEALRERYREAGYPHMRFGVWGSKDGLEREVERLRGATRYRFAWGELGFWATKPDGENVVYVEIPIEEGPRALLQSIDVVGCEDDQTCRRALASTGARPGDPFSAKEYRSWLRQVRLHFTNDGYARATVRPLCARGDPGHEDELCDPERTDATAVRLRFEVTEGERYRIGPIIVVGDFTTRRSVVDRDLPREGAWLTSSAVTTAERRLRNLGIFNSVNLTPVGLDDRLTPNLSPPLLVQLEERGYRFLDLAVGFESFNRASLLGGSRAGRMPPTASSVVEQSVQLADGVSQIVAPSVPFNLPDLLLVTQAEYVDLNLLGSAQELRIPVKYGVSTGDPARLAALAPTLLNRRFLGTDMFFRTTVYGIFDRANFPFDRVDGGLELELSQQLWRQLFVIGRYAIAATSTRSLPTFSNPTPTFANPLLLNKPEVRLLWDRQDTPTHPTRGFALAGRLAYLNALDLSSREVDNFIKYSVEGRFVFNIKQRLIFANLVRLNGSIGFRGNANATLPVNERYYLGGSLGVRGFKDGEIAQYERSGRPVDADPDRDEITRTLGANQSLLGTTEVRFPLGFSLGPMDVWGAGFLDWGGMADSLASLHAKSIRVTAGAGLRLLLYGRVPVRVDYGVKLDRRCEVYAGDDCERRETVGELEFNILYTF